MLDEALQCKEFGLEHDINNTVLPCSTQFLRHIKDFFQLAYKVEGKVEELGMEESNGDSEDCVSRQIVSLSCVGIGFSNFSKGIL